MRRRWESARVWMTNTSALIMFGSIHPNPDHRRVFSSHAWVWENWAAAWWWQSLVRASVGLKNQASFRGLILRSVWGSDVPRKALDGLGLRGSVGLLKALSRTLLVRIQWSGIGWPGGAARWPFIPYVHPRGSGSLRMPGTPPVVRSWGWLAPSFVRTQLHETANAFLLIPLSCCLEK